MPAPTRRSTRLAAILLTAVMLVACGKEAGMTPPRSVPPTSAPPTSSASEVEVPADGLTLAAFGFTNGPVREFSLPRTAVLSSKVDQVNNVAAVLSSPSPSDVAAYLRRSLPAAGFELRRNEDQTMIFDGHGWAGSFTGTNNPAGPGGTSAVLLRPQ